MDLFVGLIFGSVFLLSYTVLKAYRNLPPGPFSLPLLGSVFFFRKLKRNRPQLVFKEAAKTYGNVMSVFLGPQLMVVLQGYDTVHEALVDNADVFSGRPIRAKIFKQALMEENATGRGVLFNDYNQSWRSLRRFTLQVLRDFGVGKTSIEDKILAEVDAVVGWLDQHEGTPVCLNTQFQNMITNVLIGIVFGKRLEYDDPEFKSVSRLARVALGRSTLTPLTYLPMWLRRLINKEDTERSRAQEDSFKQMREYVLQQIDDHEASYDGNHIRDFIDLYLKTAKDGSEKFDHHDMFWVIMDLFLAGSDTTTNALDWAFLYMQEYPDVQQRCQKEIAEVVGNKTVRYADRCQLVYVEATLLEILRIASVAPNAVPHCTLKDTVFRGYNIPKDTMILASILSASQDPKFFTEPGQFRPERFIDDTGKLIRNEALIPFSTGPRQCLGEPLAKTELFLVFANLLQKFTFKPEDKAVKHTFESIQHRITNIPIPYNTRVYRRK